MPGQVEDEYILAGSPPAVKEWVLRCRKENPGVKRADRVAAQLQLPKFEIDSFEKTGIYQLLPAWFDCDLEALSINDDVPISAAGQVNLIMEVPMETEMFRRPPARYRCDESAIKNIDEIWEVQQWRSRDQSQELIASLQPLRPDTAYLADLRFRNVSKTDMPLSPRLASFVESAKLAQVGREALTVACMLERGAATFDPSDFPTSFGEQDPKCPLLRMTCILRNVESFITQAKIDANNQQKTLLDLKIYIQRLRKAEALWWKVDPHFELRGSRLSQEEQSERLVDLLSKALPEQVAHKANENWYCAGFRVRGEKLNSVSGSDWVLLFNPTEQKFSKGSADQGQYCLKPTFCLRGPKQNYVATMVLVSDSSCSEDSFLLGLTCVLRQANIFVLWALCKSGGTAKDLSIVWEKAPQADFGLTICNGNDFTRHWLWEESIGDDLRKLCESARMKCTKQSIFL